MIQKVLKVGAPIRDSASITREKRWRIPPDWMRAIDSHDPLKTTHHILFLRGAV
ncbi:hypothetical protein OAK83_01870 [bacterium]|nr:hypothetical protein [bacterium]